jgi:PilZ domain-containing protein
LPLHASDMLSARLQAIGGARTYTSQDSQHCRLLLSLGGAFIYCNRFLAVDSEVVLILDFPPEITKAGARRVWCRAKVVRIDQQLTDGKFGIALAFESVQPLPEA